jgi:hypothetical protein
MWRLDDQVKTQRVQQGLLVDQNIFSPFFVFLSKG